MIYVYLYWSNNNDIEKENAVLGNRELMGSNQDAKEGTIRKSGISIDKNSVHGSDSIENVKLNRFLFKIS